jgi:hypothetical protein
MGTCKGCKKVFNYADIKDGYCESCRVEMELEEQKKQEDTKVNVSRQETNAHSEPTDTKLLENMNENLIALKRSMIFLILVIVVSIGFYTYTILKGTRGAPVLNKPDLTTVQELVAQYDYMDDSSDAAVLASYKKDGEIVELIHVGKHICRMPMIRDEDGNWMSTGFKCGN